MSKTDINHTIKYNGAFTQVNQTKNIFTGVWNPETRVVSSELQFDGGETRKGYVTSNFKLCAKQGDLPENPFNYERYGGTYLTGTHVETTATTKQKLTGTFKPFYGLPPPLLVLDSLRKANLGNEARLDALQKVKDQKVDLATVWGERTESLNTITTAVKRFKKAWNSAKSGNWAAAANALGVKSRGRSQYRSFASGWLELQYGWMPMLMDIFGACEELQKSRDKNEYVVIRAVKKIEDTDSYLSGTDNDIVSRYAKFTVKVTIKMQRDSSFLQTLSAVGITNPIGVAWELTKYSFCVDWFVKIGSFVGQFDAALGWQLFSCSTTTIQDSRSTRTKLVARVNGATSYYWNAFNDNFYFAVTRTPVVGFSGLWSLPSFKDPVSVKHAINALTLLTQKR